MKEFICPNCSITFYDIKGNRNRVFCSRACVSGYRTNHEIIIARFKRFVNYSDSYGCYTWIGRCDRDGYGRFSYHNSSGERIRLGAHVFRWMAAYGRPKIFVCHHCDNPPCVRLSHLFLGTARDNKLDSVNKLRHAFGEFDGNSKLTEDMVIEDRKLFDSGLFTKKELALRRGISVSNMGYVLNRVTWRHLS